MFCSTVSTDQTKFPDLQRQDFPDRYTTWVNRIQLRMRLNVAYAQINNPQNSETDARGGPETKSGIGVALTKFSTGTIVKRM